MKAVVVYESMYGNTHLIADAVAAGLRASADVVVVPVGKADADTLRDVDLLVVGGPTHVHGMSRTSSRKAAVEEAQEPDSELAIDPDAEGEGLRDWFDDLGPVAAHAAAFDTRMHGPAALTGRASNGIAKRLRHHGCTMIADAESFLVSKENELDAGEATHARDWGEQLAAALANAR